MADTNTKHPKLPPGLHSAAEILEALGWALDFSPETLIRISQADSRYLTEAREELRKALERWDDDHTVPACLSCGSQRVDWVDALALYRCQVCGAEEERTSHARKAA